jgi:hypothetical protein
VTKKIERDFIPMSCNTVEYKTKKVQINIHQDYAGHGKTYSIKQNYKAGEHFIVTP